MHQFIAAHLILSHFISYRVHLISSRLLSSQTELFRGLRFHSSPANCHFSNHVSSCLCSPFFSYRCFLFHQASTSSQSFLSSRPPLLFRNTAHANRAVKASFHSSLFLLQLVQRSHHLWIYSRILTFWQLLFFSKLCSPLFYQIHLYWILMFIVPP